MIVAWVTQHLAKLDTNIVTQAQATLLGGLRDSDLDKVNQAVEPPREVHEDDAECATAAHSPTNCPSTVRHCRYGGSPTRRATHREGVELQRRHHLRRENSQHWPMESTHYGSDRIRVAHPSDDD
jgi:hypothetical protein